MPPNPDLPIPGDEDKIPYIEGKSFADLTAEEIRTTRLSLVPK